MTDEQRPAIGLSIGATNLAAVTADRAVTRRPVLTFYAQRPPEVGIPSENPKLAEPGVVITDFVDRIGDPAGIVASDGTAHRSETLVAEALRALAYTATDGRTLPMAAITYPAHWQRPAVDALRSALSRLSEWSGRRLPLLPDFAAALTALRSDPGLPARGIIAVCDFGGSGTSLTLVDAADGQPIAPTVRHRDFSGDLIDQALLNHVVADVSAGQRPDPAGTATIGSVAALRRACQRAKEELSSATSTRVAVDLPAKRDDILLTRAVLDDLVGRRLDGFVDVVRDNLQRNDVQPSGLVAVASIGGGASIPSVTVALSQQLRVPIIAAPRPRLTAAIGAALKAARGYADDGATALAPTAGAEALTGTTALIDVGPAPSAEPALAWSEADDASGIMPVRTGEYPVPRNDDGPATTRPRHASGAAARSRPAGSAAEPWYRRPAVVVIGTALVALAIGAAVVIALRHTAGNAPGTPAPTVSTTQGPATTSAPGSDSSSTDSQTPSSTTESSSEPQTTSSSTSTTTQTTSTTTTQPSTTTQAPTSTSTAPTSTQPPVLPRFPGRPGLRRQPAPPGG